jgi:Short C-terminal domain
MNYYLTTAQRGELVHIARSFFPPELSWLLGSRTLCRKIGVRRLPGEPQDANCPECRLRAGVGRTERVAPGGYAPPGDPSILKGERKGVAAELERLVALRSSGMLDDEEFRAAKARIIHGG